MDTLHAHLYDVLRCVLSCFMPFDLRRHDQKIGYANVAILQQPFPSMEVNTLLSSPGCTLKTIRKYFKHVCGNFRWRSACVTSSNCLHACNARGFHARTSVRCLHDTNDLSALKPQCFFPPCLPHLFSAPVSGSHCFMGEPSSIRWTQGETIHTCGP